jgi:hypothetical protein
MPGLRDDQIAVFRKDMYKFEKDGMKELTPKYPKIFRVIPNCKGPGHKVTQRLESAKFERHTAEGQDIEFRSPIQGWEALVKYWTFSDGLSFSKEAVEDAVKLGNMLNEYARDWGEEGVRIKEQTAALVFNRGGDLLGEWIFDGSYIGETDSSGDMMYDSEPLFNLTGNTRSTKGGGTYYNSFAGYTMTPSNFETVYNHLTATNNRDEMDKEKENPVDTVLCRPGADFLAAKRITQSDKLPFSQSNDINPYEDLIDEIIKWDFLSSTEAASFIGKRQHKSWEFHERQKQETDFFRDRNNRGYKASVDVRFGIFLKPGAWRAWGRMGGSAD